MRKSTLLLILALVVFMSTCDIAWLWECSLDSDCDDGNPCTEDVCESEPDSSCDYESWCDDCYHYWCENRDVDDGTPCEEGWQLGVCQSGECRFEGEA